MVGLGTVSTSCEDMFTTDNSLVTDDLTPQDTVYQVMGIVRQMQNLVDKTILLGEVRADLVDYNSSSSVDIQDLANNTVDLDNKYNQPADYYAVINSCNIYLAHVDSLLETHGEKYYEKEMAAVKAYRAWAYLELAKIYKEVPFVTEPIVTADAADKVLQSGKKSGMQEICEYFIKDLQPYASQAKNRELIPTYGNSTYRLYFIPARVMMAELYLWKGTFSKSKQDFIEAARYYHDFFTFPNEEVLNGLSIYSEWNDKDFRMVSQNKLYYQTGLSSQLTANAIITAVPMDSSSYDGNYSDLGELFNSKYRNNYYAAVTPSQALLELSQSQDYCYENQQTTTKFDTIFAPKDKSMLFVNDEAYVGDLRYSLCYKYESVNDKDHSTFSTSRQEIAKYGGSSEDRVDYVRLYRTSILYLHMAEALNRAGFPETAFTVLKYGLSESSLAKFVSQEERDRLAQITSVGISGDFTKWDANVFRTRWEDHAIGKSSYTSSGSSSSNYVVGSHAMGSGQVEANKSYALLMPEGYQTLPTLTSESTAEDTLAYNAIVEANQALLDDATFQEKRQIALDKLIADEEALEGAYEGNRFYDLLRYAVYHNDPSYLAEKIAQRKGKDNVDESLKARLLNESNWYLPLPTR